MARMASKYSGQCSACGENFPAGTDINYNRRAPRGLKARHVDCSNPTQGADPTGQITVFRTSGGEFYRNSRGTCEDAPCCGCCTF